MSNNDLTIATDNKFSSNSVHKELNIKNDMRIEPSKIFIIKLLLDLGLSPNGNAIAVIARLTEALATNPDIEFSRVVEQFAKSHDATVAAVEHIIEKSLNVYDGEFMERLEKRINSKPITSKDVLCDIAVFVRFNYLNGLNRNE